MFKYVEVKKKVSKLMAMQQQFHIIIISIKIVHNCTLNMGRDFCFVISFSVNGRCALQGHPNKDQ